MRLVKFYRQKLTKLSKSLTYFSHPFILFPQSQEILFSYGSAMTSSLTQKQITSMLRAWGAGDSEVSEELIRIVYQEFGKRARYRLQHERSNHTLQTTALINETYIKLVEQRAMKWENRSQFFGVAAEIMRRILVDHAKTRHRQKRGGVAENLPLETALSIVAPNEKDIDVIALRRSLKPISNNR